MVIRNLSEAVQLALRLRAAASGQSVEGEVREIIEAAVLPVGRLLMGTALLNIGSGAGGLSLHAEWPVEAHVARPVAGSGAEVVHVE